MENPNDNDSNNGEKKAPGSRRYSLKYIEGDCVQFLSDYEVKRFADYLWKTYRIGYEDHGSSKFTLMLGLMNAHDQYFPLRARDWFVDIGRGTRIVVPAKEFHGRWTRIKDASGRGK